MARLPGTGHTGDRVRAEMHLSALREAGFETTVVGGAPHGQRAPAIEGVAAVHGVPTRFSPFALARAAITGDPLQSALFAGPWDRTLKRAGTDFALVVVLLARIWPQLRRSLPEAPTVLDYIDALAYAASDAARTDPALWRRLYWRVEAPRLLLVERAARATRRLATTPFDAEHLPPGTEALPHGVAIGPAPDAAGSRPPVVAFSGRLMYRPNELAARRLVQEIWPLVRREIPNAELVLGGADAPRHLRLLDGANGVRVESPVAEMPAFLRRARAVAAPVDLGSGTPNKIYEALEAGCPVVASEGVAARAAIRGTPAPVRSASTNAAFAAALVDYLRDPARATADGAAGRRFAETHADRREAVSHLARIFRDVARGNG